jgi:hypothetical protein
MSLLEAATTYAVWCKVYIRLVLYVPARRHGISTARRADWYRTDDGTREGTCQDWEIEATFHKWSGLYGDQKTLTQMQKVLGEDYPKKGMLLAMGTHSLHQDTWLINGVVRQADIRQSSPF